MLEFGWRVVNVKQPQQEGRRSGTEQQDCHHANGRGAIAGFNLA
jgi:hypothetical protein